MTIITSGCKINLGLRIKERRPDGYHNLESIFYPVAWPRDYLIIGRYEKPGLYIRSLPANIDRENNTLVKIYEEFCRLTGQKPGLVLDIRKHVPTGAGLGGGSANAAAFLRWLNAFCATRLTPGAMHEAAAATGSDVPFFLHDSPCTISGRGEIIRPLPFAANGLWLVIVFPGISIGTARIFGMWDKSHACNLLTNSNDQANDSGSLRDPRINIDTRNDLEDPVYELWPELSRLKENLMAAGALCAAMSGSGSAHYGIFANPDTAAGAANFFRKKDMRAYMLPMSSFGV